MALDGISLTMIPCIFETVYVSFFWMKDYSREGLLEGGFYTFMLYTKQKA